MTGDSIVGDDVAADVSAGKDDVGLHMSVSEDDVEVGTKKRRQETGPEVGHGHGDAIVSLCSEEGESRSEESESEEEAKRLGDNQVLAKRPFFILGMTFSNVEEIKRAINQYAIIEGVELRILKSEPTRIRVICQEGCPFVFYASKEGDNLGLKVKTLYHEHKCHRVSKNPRASAKWLAEHFKNKILESPKYKVSAMQLDVEAEFKLHVSIHKCKRAKKLIMEEMKGSYKDESRNLKADCIKLSSSNPGKDVSIEGHNKSTCRNGSPSTSTNTTGKKRGRPKKVNIVDCSEQIQITHCQPITIVRPEQSQITEAELCQPITTVRPKLPVRSSYKKRAECDIGIRFGLATGQC